MDGGRDIDGSITSDGGIKKVGCSRRKGDEGPFWCDLVTDDTTRFFALSSKRTVSKPFMFLRSSAFRRVRRDFISCLNATDGSAFRAMQEKM